MSAALSVVAVFCIFAFIVIVLIVWVYVRGRRDTLSEFSPEQQKGLHFQNKVLLFVVLALAIPGAVTSFVLNLFGVDTNSEAVKNVLNTYAFYLLSGITTLIALSSIVSRASIIPPSRRFRSGARFSKDEAAVNLGVFILLMVVVAWIAWFAQ